jgi:hypothetical protein
MKLHIQSALSLQEQICQYLVRTERKVLNFLSFDKNELFTYYMFTSILNLYVVSKGDNMIYYCIMQETKIPYTHTSI